MEVLLLLNAFEDIHFEAVEAHRCTPVNQLDHHEFMRGPTQVFRDLEHWSSRF